MADELPYGDKLLLQAGRCPDCFSMPLSCWSTPTIVFGPRGGIATNKACSNCGAEFNDLVFRVDRNSPKGKPNHERLRLVYNIVLSDRT